MCIVFAIKIISSIWPESDYGFILFPITVKSLISVSYMASHRFIAMLTLPNEEKVMLASLKMSDTAALKLVKILFFIASLPFDKSLKPVKENAVSQIPYLAIWDSINVLYRNQLTYAISY